MRQVDEKRRPSMELFDHPLSPYSLKVRVALYEKGLAFDLHEIWSHEDGEALRALNPRAEVPALRDGDTVVYDSRIICDYLDDRHPESPLMPSDPAARAACRTLEAIADTQLDPCVLVLALYKVFRPGLVDTHPAAFDQATGILRRHYTNLDGKLGGRQFLGGAFSRADIACFPHFTFTAFLGAGVGDEHPRLAAWFARMNDRPSCQRVAAEAMAAIDQSKSVATPFFDRERLHWRSDRIEMLLRLGLGPWLLEELEANRGFLPDVP